MQLRVETFLPVLKDINGYGDVKQPERDALTAAIADLVSLMERQQFAYIAKSSKDDFDWAERAAIGARQTDTWFRRMPLGWKLEDGLEWTRYAMQVRDRSMADNLEWVRSRLGPRGRVLVFAAAGHLASTVVQVPTQPMREMIPLGAYTQGPLRVRLHQHTQPGRERRNRLLLCEPAKADAAQAAAGLGNRESVRRRECSPIRAGSAACTAWRINLAAPGARSLEWIWDGSIRDSRRFRSRLLRQSGDVCLCAPGRTADMRHVVLLNGRGEAIC